MNLQSAFQWLNDTQFGVAVRESPLLFPLFNAIHILGLCALMGSIAILDLRLLGVIYRDEPVSEVARSVLRVTWVGFAVAVVSGFALLASEATRAYANPAFRWKLVLLALAGLNPLIFHTTIFRRVNEWDTGSAIPWNARAAGAISITLWTGILVAGRAMAYF